MVVDIKLGNNCSLNYGWMLRSGTASIEANMIDRIWHATRFYWIWQKLTFSELLTSYGWLRFTFLLSSTVILFFYLSHHHQVCSQNRNIISLQLVLLGPSVELVPFICAWSWEYSKLAVGLLTALWVWLSMPSFLFHETR